MTDAQLDFEAAQVVDTVQLSAEARFLRWLENPVNAWALGITGCLAMVEAAAWLWSVGQ